MNNNNRKSWKRVDLKQKQRAVVITGHSQQITSALLTVTTHWLVAFQVSDIWFCLQLFWTGTASVSVSAASAAAHLVPTAVAAFPSMYSALSSSASCCRTFRRALLLLVLLE